MRPGAPRVNHPLDQQLHCPTGGLGAEQARRDHAGIVQNEQIAGHHEPGQITDPPILPMARRPFQAQQAGGRAIRQGKLGDLFGGKLEVKISGLHGGAC